jgi:DNA-binding protein H-NS
MATIDLSKYNLGELKGLQYDIDREIKTRQHQELKKAREQILSIAQSVGLSPEELLAKGRKTPKAGKSSTADSQYRNPGNDRQTWTGRGRQPKWVVDALAKGKKLEELRVQ